jgi:hypothetical protein
MVRFAGAARTLRFLEQSMANVPSFDSEQAHKYFSANCFNLAWELIGKPERTAEEDEQMIRLAQASLWHWTERSDCNDKNLSIGYWQASRVYALLGQADNARKYAQLCLEKTPADDPFCLGYAYEALARAESIAANAETANAHLAQAWQHAEAVSDEDAKQLLVDDLQTLA